MGNITRLKQDSLDGLRRQTNECLDNAYRRGYDDGRIDATNTGLVKELKQAEYNKGLEDARQILLSLLEIPSGEWVNVFDTDSYYVEAILKHYSINEIQSRIEAYKEKKKAGNESIKVGDEVRNEDVIQSVIVTNVYDNGHFDGINSNGVVYCNYNPELWNKTGRHFEEVGQLLNKLKNGIGEE